jgi:hypothetical protein
MNIVLALIASIAASLGLITALLELFAVRRARKTAAAIQEVHVLVNKQLSDVLARVAQLTEVMHAGGLDVPPAPLHLNDSKPV